MNESETGNRFMNSSEKNKCMRCGAPIPASSTDELCPACLMSGALKRGDSGQQTIRIAPGLSASTREPDKFPCEFGGYRLLGLLGRGGMGTVYEAEQLATGRRVALKVLGHQLDSPDMRHRFLREGRLAAGIRHPNSLYVFGSGEIQGVPVITMEIASSGTLKDQLKKEGPLPVTEAVDAILDVIAGLEAAFQAGVLHRDIKPSNCFVSPDGSVKIGDFGISLSTLARDDSYVTATGVIVGTPAYASPEQLRGDTLDVRADIYAVGATLFTLLTNRAPFEGENAVQVVAQAVNQKPIALTEFRQEVPPGLDRVVARCLAKEPDGRYLGYPALRDALLPFSSKEPEPASILVRTSAGWIDFLIALLPPYIALMFLVGAEDLLIRPLNERTLFSARYYFLLLGCGILYFSIAEGIWGAGLGKWLRGLQVVRLNGRPPGIGRALIRILIPLLCVEGVRWPVTMTFISGGDWSGLQTAGFVLTAIVCGWLPVLLALRARRENGFTTVWDLLSGTRVVVRAKGTVRPVIQSVAEQNFTAAGADSIGPYQVIKEMIPGQWLLATDPVLRRQAWLRRRISADLSFARRNVSRIGRLRWLQTVDQADGAWDAFEAPPGVPFASLVADGKRIAWSGLRHWLHDLASELWAATGDQTVPAELGLDHIWITADGRAILLDQPWPAANVPAERIPVGTLAGQQQFLNAVAACVESTSLPLHARPVLQNLAAGKFERFSFFTGTLRGLLDKPAEVSRGIRAGALFLVPFYVWVAIFVGYYHDKPWTDPLGGIVIVSAVVALGAALMQLLGLPFRSTIGHSIFRLAVVNTRGEPATRKHLLARWVIIWLPLFLPTLLVPVLLQRTGGIVSTSEFVLLFLWLGTAVYAVVHPQRGLHDRLASTWVVRR